MRDNWLSNRIYQSYHDIVAHCCFASNKLVDQPWRIMSIGLRRRAHGSWSMRVGIRWLLRYSIGSRPLPDPGNRQRQLPVQGQCSSAQTTKGKSHHL